MTPLTRRSFLQSIALMLTTLSSSWAIGREGLDAAGKIHTLSLHMDRPFLGRDETLWEYQPRGVIGGARALATLSDAEVRAHYPYL
jgi:hypothetical protein